LFDNLPYAYAFVNYVEKEHRFMVGGRAALRYRFLTKSTVLLLFSVTVHRFGASIPQAETAIVKSGLYGAVVKVIK